MQFCRCPIHAFSQLANWKCLIFNTKSDLAVCIHIEKLCPWVLKHRSNLCGNLVHRKITDFLTIHQYAARQLSCVKLWDQAVYKPRDGGLSAAAPATEQNTFSVLYGQVDVMQPVSCLSLISK